MACFFYQSTENSVKIKMYVKCTTQILIVSLHSTYGALTYFQAYVYIPANDTARQRNFIAVLKALAWVVWIILLSILEKPQ